MIVSFNEIANCVRLVVKNCPVGHNMLGETVKRLSKDAGIEGQFTNHSLCPMTATRELQKGISYKFAIVMKRTGQRDFISLQKYQRSDISSKTEISKKCDSCEAGSITAESVAPGKLS